MSYKVLEELLNATDLSDESDDVASATSCSTLTLDVHDYNEVLKDILHDVDGESPSESHDDITPVGSSFQTAKPCDTDLGQQVFNDFGPTRNTSLSRSSSLCTNGAVAPASSREDAEIHGDVNEPIPSEDAGSDKETCGIDVNASRCQCHIKYRTAIGRLVNTPCPLLALLRPVVHRELCKPETVHKIAYLQNCRRQSPDYSSNSSDHDVESDIEMLNDSYILEPSKSCLERLGLLYKPIDTSEKANLIIRCRHNLATALERLQLFNDDFIPINSGRSNSVLSGKSLSPSCIIASNNFLVVGTTNGSLLVCDISNYNTKRQFKPNPDQCDPKDSKILVWQEIDTQNDGGVTYVDIVPESNWICVGYSNGMVKLLRLNKDAVQNQHVEQKNANASETIPSPEPGPQGRGFGLMADAVSSAFGGFRKAGPHVVCSAKPFESAVVTCKFTVGESHDEIICTNGSSVALLTYNKTVLSHNLNVNYVNNFTSRLLENDDLVDLACLASNPQSKYITGVTVSGLVAFATIKRCFVIATRPELSVLFRVPFTERAKDSDGSGYAIPSITWMVLNNSGEIMPVLLIVLGSRISFTLCNLATVKRGGPPVTCTHVGYIKFDTVIRNVHTVSRDMLAVIDLNNILHIFQVNVFNNVMYYDVIRSVDLGQETADLWHTMVNIGPTISVHARTVKMMANSYKKFSALVSELFQGKRNEAYFELRVVSLYILTSKGLWTSEIHSWIKTIGDLTATKRFDDALAISYALSNGMVPGLLDYKAYVDNIKKLVMYVLHQSCAHIIRLSKLMDTEPIAEEEPNSGWSDKLKDDISTQIDDLCCSMFDVCLRMNLYDCLNDLVYRCFATVCMHQVFVKYVLLYYHNDRVELASFKSVVFESIFNFYDRVLDSLKSDYLGDLTNIENLLVLMRDNVEHRYRGQCCYDETDFQITVDERALLAEILCNHLAKLYVLCSRNVIALNTDKTVSMLSKHACWQVFVYCKELIANDITVAIDSLYTESANRINELRSALSPSIGYSPWEQTEGFYVVRVLYSVINSFLTFDNCGLGSESAVTNFCKVLEYLTSTGSFKPVFPLVPNLIYARSDLVYEEKNIDYENMDCLTFECYGSTDAVSPVLQNLMSFSPRLLFTCFANLLMAPDTTLDQYADILGTRIDIFNFVLSILIRCLSTFEGSQSTYTVRSMLSMLILGVASFSESCYLTTHTQAVAVYTLLTEVCDSESTPFIQPGDLSTKELVLPDGSFNNAYFIHSFCKESDQIYDNVRQFNMTPSTTRNLLMLHVRRILCAIYRKYDCQPNRTQNAHFANIKRLCAGVLPLVSDFETRIFLCEVTGNYSGAIKAWESLGNGKVFTYIQQCIDHIKSGTIHPDYTVNQMLLLDPSVQREFVLTLMDELPHLIKVDLQSSTALLIDMFSISSLASVFKEAALQSSQDIVLSTLKDTPDLQLMVLNALLGASKNTPDDGLDFGSGDYFKQYLRLLCKDDPKSVCPFLKRQHKLDIPECLSICIKAGIHDAVSHLLMRAGDFTASARWLLEAIYAVGEDMEWCLRLVHDACSLCLKFEYCTANENLEFLWFGILRYLVESDPVGNRFGAIIEVVFHKGIYQFTRLTNALFELRKYNYADVSTFKRPLRRLLCDLEFQMFVSTASSSMSTGVLRDQFRHSVGHNQRGVILGVDSDERPRSSIKCGVCKAAIWPLLSEDGPKGESATSSGRYQSTFSGNLSLLERQIGVMASLSDNGSSAPTGITHFHNMYTDRLSSLMNKNTATGVPRSNWNRAISGITAQITDTTLSRRGNEPMYGPSVRVFWCGHLFHAACSSNSCATCAYGN
ncbi:uncharacterized protein BBOV_IV004860 [Babesia bovis T2Bo]|uniref:Vacuolar protein sorting-associated protein 8 central domain-containing protein n=1 Tax=Babesia bovis TaxID=5865 RepID=A7AQM8_BABBO|nr:uncharacterized protein BBOV_IV004860 [Babesia bovis T2Bo]EDO06847.1 hypothetical protein BBOV_IV004860 [Babesia bovis T2Bo]|eukprot:XP_001610415.1 hypothetical protein [Babesia bovis T2Bo]